EELVAVLGAPGLRPAEEHALLAGEAVEDRRRLAAQRNAIRVQRDREPREVGDVFAEREAAVDARPGQELELSVLIDQPVGLVLEAMGILGRPPVVEPAIAVVLASLV